MRLSKSKIGTFTQCPYHYKLKYIDKWFPEKTPLQLLEGGEKHKVFEEVIKTAKIVSAKDSNDIVEQTMQKHKSYKKYKQDCDNLVKFQKKVKSLPIYEEEEIYDEEMNLIGIIDRVDMTKHGLMIIDYKTGKSSTDISKYRFELAIYAYLFEKKHNQRVCGWGILFTNDGTFIQEPRNQVAINEAIAEVTKIRKQIEEREKSNEWPKCYSPLCGWCDAYQNGKCKGEDEFLFGGN